MKTVISNYPGEALEVAKRVMYSLKVLMIGLFIPASFIFGITYNRHIENIASKVNILKQDVAIGGNTITWYAKILPNQNS